MASVDGSLRIDARINGGNLDQDAKTIEQKLHGVFTSAAKTATAALAGIGAALGGMAVAGVKAADDIKQAMNQFASSTGTAREELEGYQDVLEKIYANNYGEDFTDIADAMASVKKELGNLSDDAMQTVTESAFALRDVFEYEIPETVRASKAMMDNFGVSGEEAMNLIANGAQNGLDYSGELIDSINEYSVQFSKLGLSADDMFNIFQKGADSGAWNLDKIGDSIKELSIRVIDGSDTTREGFELLGFDADTMIQKFAQGGESAKDAFELVIASLNNMKDPIALNTAGVNLFGTMWEDMGPEVVKQLTNVSGAAYGSADALTQIKNIRYDDLQSVFEGLRRTIELAAVPIGEAVIPALANLAQYAGEVVQALSTAFQEGGVEGFVKELLNQISNLATEIAAHAPEMIEAGAKFVQAFAQGVIENSGRIAEAAASLVQALLDSVGQAIPALQPLADSFQILADNAEVAFAAIIGGILGIETAGLLIKISAMAEGVGSLAGAMKLAGTAISGAFSSPTVVLGVLFGMLAALFVAANKVVEVWDAMSDSERAVSAISLLAGAVGILVVAVSALLGVGNIAITVAGLAAGVAGVAVALGTAKKASVRKKTSGGGIYLGEGLSWANPPSAKSSYSVPKLATGAVIPANGEFLAVLGDQKSGRNLEAPEGLLRQIVREETADSGGETLVTVRFEGSLAQLARAVEPHIEVARNNRGTSLTKRRD